MFNDFKDVRVLTRMALGLAVLIVCSYLSFPLWGFPAPITMQTFALCLIGLVYKPKQALAIILLYLLLGAVGLPVFAGGRGGFASFVGPAGGYLFSFPIAYTLLSIFKGKKPSFVSYALRTLIITVPIVTVMGIWGFVQFAHMDLTKAVTTALIFVPGDLLKAVVSGFLADRLQVVTRHFN